MDYRIFAVDELRKLKQNYIAEKIIKSRILELDTELKSVGGGMGGATPNSGGGSKTEQRWLSLMASISDEKARLRKVIRDIKRTEAALAAISEDGARILREEFIKERSMQDIAVAEHQSRRTVYRVRKTALIDFTRALYGAVVT